MNRLLTAAAASLLVCLLAASCSNESSESADAVPADAPEPASDG